MSNSLEGRRILVVEDDPHVFDLVQTALETAGLVVFGATDGEEGLRRHRAIGPDLVVLDVNLPDMSGFDVLKHLREGSNVPVVMLTVQNRDEDRVRGLELGADDYIGKPFNHRELVGRVRAVLRRTEAVPPLPSNRTVALAEGLSVDFDRRRVIARGEPVRLRPTEFKLLAQLMSQPGRLQTHETLLSRVWGPEYRDDIQLLRLYVTYLRKKLESDPAHPRYILNERGLGYRFCEPGPDGVSPPV